MDNIIKQFQMHKIILEKNINLYIYIYYENTLKTLICF